MNERVMPDTGWLMADEVLFTIDYSLLPNIPGIHFI